MIVRVAGRIIPRKTIAVLLASTTAISAMAYAQLTPDREDIVLFEANTVTRAQTDSPIVAAGDVKAYFGQQFLTSDKVIYDPVTDIVTAAGNVTITDPEGQTFFADEVELTGDLADGIATNFSALLAENAKLAGSSVIKTGDERNELTKAVYTACDVCKENGDKKRPTWRVKALKVTQDRENNVIRFNNAIFEVLGVPAFYSPYLQIPDPSQERQSGFLFPSFGSTTQQGLYLETPYYFAISEHQDATFYPRYMERQGVLYQGEYRYRTARGGGIFQGGIIETRGSEIEELADPELQFPLNLPDLRFHIYGQAEQEFLDKWKAGFNTNYVSDKAYIRTYDIVPKDDLRGPAKTFRPDRLTSQFYINRRTEDSLLSIQALGFQSLRNAEDNDFAAQTLPRIQYNSNIFDTPLIGGQTTVDLSMVSLFRKEGLNNVRISASAKWDRVFTTSNGQRFRLYSELRGDAYNYEDLDQGNESCNNSTEVIRDFDDDPIVNTAAAEAAFQDCLQFFPEGGQEASSSKSRFLPTAGLEWSYPLVRSNSKSTIIIEPKVQLVVSTDEDFNAEIVTSNGTPGFVTEIINEDSQFFQFDTTSLFDWNKSSGYDLWENGTRANIGITSSAVFDNGLSLEGAIGQQFRSEETNIYSAYGLTPGLGDTESDIVGSFDIRWSSAFNLDTRFRIDKDDGTIRRAESKFRGRLGRFNTSVSYVNVQPIEAGQNEFLFAALSYDLTKNWTIGGRWREDLDAGKTTQQILTLGYQDECSKLLLAYRVDNTNQDGFEFGDSLTINLELAGFSN